LYARSLFGNHRGRGTCDARSDGSVGDGYYNPGLYGDQRGYQKQFEFDDMGGDGSSYGGGVYIGDFHVDGVYPGGSYGGDAHDGGFGGNGFHGDDSFRGGANSDSSLHGYDGDSSLHGGDGYCGRSSCRGDDYPQTGPCLFVAIALAPNFR